MIDESVQDKKAEKATKFANTVDEPLLTDSLGSKNSGSSYNADVKKFLESTNTREKSLRTIDDPDNPFYDSSSIPSIETNEMIMRHSEQRIEEKEHHHHDLREMHLKQSTRPSSRTKRFLNKSHVADTTYSSSYHARRIIPKAFRLVKTFVQSTIHGTPLWILKFLGLMAFVISLLPGFVVFGWYYFMNCDRIVVSYKEKNKGATSRHFMDVYGSTLRYERIVRSDEDSADEEDEVLKPVVIFVSGGAWIIGYKMWGALLARAMVPFGVLVCMPDYRNFPGVTVGNMVRDVDDSVQWVLDNIREFGGDPKRVVLVGQSAGAHLGSCVVMRKALTELNPSAPPTADFRLSTTYKNTDLQGFIPISGPYNLVALRGHFHKHGLDKNIVSAMFGNDIEPHSPYHLFQRCMDRLDEIAREEGADGVAVNEDCDDNDCKKDESNEKRVQVPPNLFPPICVIHGTADKTAPLEGATQFAALLRDGGVDLITKLYPGWSHTDPVIEAPMEGDHTLHRDVYNLVKVWTTSTTKTIHDFDGSDSDDDEGDTKRVEMKEMALMVPFDEKEKICGRLCPPKLVAIGRFFNPF